MMKLFEQIYQGRKSKNRRLDVKNGVSLSYTIKPGKMQLFLNWNKLVREGGQYVQVIENYAGNIYAALSRSTNSR